MRLVLLGPPAAGKGTQAQDISERRGWPHLSSGDILRAEMKAGSELGEQARAYVEAGKLVPDELVVSLMVDRAARDDCHAGFILDGFPRTDVQAEALDAALAGRGLTLDGVVYFHCPDEVVVDRISGRRSCPRCGAVYHLRSMPPAKPGVCDRCGTELAQRKDDTADVVGERLATYRRQTEPLIEYYRRRGLLFQIDAEQPIESVREQLQRTVENLAGAS